MLPDGSLPDLLQKSNPVSLLSEKSGKFLPKSPLLSKLFYDDLSTTIVEGIQSFQSILLFCDEAANFLFQEKIRFGLRRRRTSRWLRILWWLCTLNNATIAGILAGQ